jgi:hypothetical protein
VSLVVFERPVSLALKAVKLDNLGEERRQYLVWREHFTFLEALHARVVVGCRLGALFFCKTFEASHTSSRCANWAL